MVNTQVRTVHGPYGAGNFIDSRASLSKMRSLGVWVNSSAGRASPLQGECRGFDPLFTHQTLPLPGHRVRWSVVSGPVVQLVRMPPCHGGGHGFKSRPGRHSMYCFRCLPWFVCAVLVALLRTLRAVHEASSAAFLWFVCAVLVALLRTLRAVHEACSVTFPWFVCAVLVALLRTRGADVRLSVFSISFPRS
jgi:uncharacterized MAPEG superfamily protein